MPIRYIYIYAYYTILTPKPPPMYANMVSMERLGYKNPSSAKKFVDDDLSND